MKAFLDQPQISPASELKALDGRHNISFRAPVPPSQGADTSACPVFALDVTQGAFQVFVGGYMGELEKKDSLDLSLSSTSLPAFCSTELDDLLTIFNANHQQTHTRSRQGQKMSLPHGSTDMALLGSQPSLRPFLTLQAVSSSQQSPSPSQPVTDGLGNHSGGVIFQEKLCPPRRASWGGPAGVSTYVCPSSNTVTQTVTSIPPFVQCISSSGAAVVPTPTPFAAPRAAPKDATGSNCGVVPPLPHSAPFSKGSVPARENSNGQSSSGGSSSTPLSRTDQPAEQMADNDTPVEGSYGGKISFTQNAQMFISGAPFVFQADGIKEEEGSPMSVQPGGTGAGPVGDPKATAHRRLEARKERNRRAQRTFRQRQKLKMQDLEAELAELMARRDALKTSNATLGANVSLLNKVLEVREQQRLELERKEVEAERRWFERDILSRTMQSCQQAPCFLSVYLQNGKPTKLSVDFIAQMTQEQAYDIFMVYGNEICSCVELLGSGTLDIAHLDQVTRELTHVLVLYFHMNVENFSKVRSIAERAAPGDFNIIRTMTDAARAIGLEAWQKHRIAEKWKWLNNRRAANEAEAKSVTAELRAILPTENTFDAISQEFLHTHKLLDRIKHHFQEWHEMKMQYVYYTCCETLNPMQIARMVAECFPMLPNVLWLGAILAHDIGAIDEMPNTEVGQTFEMCNLAMKDRRDVLAGQLIGDDVNCLTANCSQEMISMSPICEDFNGQFVPSQI